MRIQRFETPEGPRAVRRDGNGRWWSVGAPGATHREDPIDEAALGRLLPPVVPGKIIAVGLNYLDHIREAQMQAPEQPLLFAKFPSVVIADGEAIEFDPAITARVDWEVELAVVIGSTARDVPAASALEHVYGYTIANDVSARDLQFADGQWIRGKNLDTFCPLGPVLVTADEIPDPNDLAIRTTVNGRTVQDSSTALMLFPVAELISYCSQHTTLHPGDVILTGTPWGCGEFADPPVHLRHGDIVTCEIDGIGALTNPVVHVERSHMRKVAA